jgi:hypothetical protein
MGLHHLSENQYGETLIQRLSITAPESLPEMMGDLEEPAQSAQNGSHQYGMRPIPCSYKACDTACQPCTILSAHRLGNAYGLPGVPGRICPPRSDRMCRRNSSGACITHRGVLRQACEPQEEDLFGGCQTRGPDRDIAVRGVAVTIGADVITAGVRSTVHEQIEGVVRYAAVGVHTTVVGAADLPLAVMIWVIVLARVGHVAEAHHNVGR